VLGALLSVVLASTAQAARPIPVIPGAVGFGIQTPAGRGGKVIRVTNLQDRGPGSLRAALRAQGARVVVFEVAGTIELDANIVIANPNVTLAGQTAPEPGITITGQTLVVAASDVLIQHVALRPGNAGVCDPCNRDALGIEAPNPGTVTRNVVIDHVSASWSLDEMVALWGSHGIVEDVTIRHCLFGQPLRNLSNGRNNMTFGPLIGRNSRRVAFLSNVIAFAQSRNPLVRDDVTDVVIVNNVIYRPGTYATNKIDFGAAGDGDVPLRASVEGNVVIARPDDANPFAVSIHPKAASSLQIYLDNNRVYAPRGRSGDWEWLPKNGDPWDPKLVLTKGRDISSIRARQRPIWVQGLEPLRTDIEASIMKRAGARPSVRDPVDRRILGEIRERRGSFVDRPEDDGGYAKEASRTREVRLPALPESDTDGNGYTNLEEWLQSQAAALQ